MWLLLALALALFTRIRSALTATAAAVDSSQWLNEGRRRNRADIDVTRNC